MGTLQEMAHSLIEEQLKSGLALKMMVRRKFASMGLVLSERQIAYVARRLREGHGSEANIRINEKHLVNARDVMQRGFTGGHQISFSEDDIEATMKEVTSWTPGLIERLSKTVTTHLLAHLKRHGKEYVANLNRVRQGFESRLARTWQKPLHLLDLFLAIALQSGADFNRESSPGREEKDKELFYVLTRLHARACQASAEIVSLLKAGFADGAHARWRTLHEIAVVSTFIAKHGNEAARQYLAHDAIESRKAATQYQKHCRAIGQRPLDVKQMTEIQNRYAKAVVLFGKTFSGSYGWAAASLSMKGPTFSDIEKDVKLDTLSPYYRMASHNIHANPKGISVKLGLGSERGKVLLAGPSNTGLLEPAQGMALSLLQTTSALFGIQSNLDTIVTLQVLISLQNQVALAFAETQKRLESKKSTNVLI
jgi:hypothetical protein